MNRQLGTIKLHDAATANGNGQILNLQACDSVSLQISGTFNATIFFETTLDGSHWVECAAYDLNSTGATKAKSHTAPGLFHVDGLGGCLSFRARIGSYSSGSVTVTANAHTG